MISIAQPPFWAVFFWGETRIKGYFAIAIVNGLVKVILILLRRLMAFWENALLGTFSMLAGSGQNSDGSPVASAPDYFECDFV